MINVSYFTRIRCLLSLISHCILSSAALQREEEKVSFASSRITTDTSEKVRKQNLPSLLSMKLLFFWGSALIYAIVKWNVPECKYEELHTSDWLSKTMPVSIIGFVQHNPPSAPRSHMHGDANRINSCLGAKENSVDLCSIAWKRSLRDIRYSKKESSSFQTLGLPSKCWERRIQTVAGRRVHIVSETKM